MNKQELLAKKDKFTEQLIELECKDYEAEIAPLVQEYHDKVLAEHKQNDLQDKTRLETYNELLDELIAECDNSAGVCDNSAGVCDNSAGVCDNSAGVCVVCGNVENNDDLSNVTDVNLSDVTEQTEQTV